jgi:hypothetical protein
MRRPLRRAERALRAAAAKEPIAPRRASSAGAKKAPVPPAENAGPRIADGTIAVSPPLPASSPPATLQPLNGRPPPQRRALPVRGAREGEGKREGGPGRRAAPRVDLDPLDAAGRVNSRPITSPELAAALAPLARLLARLMRAELAAAGEADPDPWVPHPRWPFGGRKTNLRIACSGALAACHVGRLYLARRSEIDRYVQAHAVLRPAPEPPANDVDDMDAAVAAVLAEVGHELVPSPPPRRRTR